MKHIFITILVILILAGLGWAGFWAWKNLRGAGPAIKPSPGDISESINNTDFPLKLPPGFSISIFAKDLLAPRVMTYDSSGNILVSIPSQGKIVALPDKNGDGKADENVTVISGLNRPHGMSLKCVGLAEGCKLFIAESHQVISYDYDAENLKALKPEKIADLPDDGNHFTRTLLFMPYPEDRRLLISVGSSCNVCEERDWRRAKILVQDEKGLNIFARGLRNAVFMAIHPVSGKIWATEMGRDLLGDDLPPDEINIIEEGKNYGWPICYGKNIHDMNFDKKTYIRNPCEEPFETPSHIDIPAHSAPLGLAFFPEEGWPEDYWHNLLVAYHGSWNRSVPTGYKIVRYKLDEKGNYLGEEDFISGWLTSQGALGRPVDILIQPGGIIYISDDKAGVIYKVIYGGNKSDLIQVQSPKPNEIVTSPLLISGEARGFWFFEASFPVSLYDANGKLLARGPAQADGEWMTENFVPFKLGLKFPAPETDTGFLVLEKDNPSGLPENADEIRIPVRFR